MVMLLWVCQEWAQPTVPMPGSHSGPSVLCRGETLLSPQVVLNDPSVSCQFLLLGAGGTWSQAEQQVDLAGRGQVWIPQKGLIPLCHGAWVEQSPWCYTSVPPSLQDRTRHHAMQTKCPRWRVAEDLEAQWRRLGHPQGQSGQTAWGGGAACRRGTAACWGVS